MKAQNRKHLKKTKWYVGVNPLKSRPGWYQCKCCRTMFWWDGEQWKRSSDATYVIGMNQPWRGIAR